jgi:hypothetical protein
MFGGGSSNGVKNSETGNGNVKIMASGENHGVAKRNQNGINMKASAI